MQEKVLAALASVLFHGYSPFYIDGMYLVVIINSIHDINSNVGFLHRLVYKIITA